MVSKICNFVKGVLAFIPTFQSVRIFIRSLLLVLTTKSCTSVVRKKGITWFVPVFP